MAEPSEKVTRGDDWVKRHKTALIISGIAVGLLFLFLFFRNRSSTATTANTAALANTNPLLTSGDLSSLVGPAGPAGPAGPTGPAGPQGKPGKPGKKPPKHHHSSANTSMGTVPASQLTHAHITHTGGGTHTTKNFQHR